MRDRKHLNSSRAIEAKQFCSSILHNSRWHRLTGLNEVKAFFDFAKPGERTRFFPQWTTLLIFLEQVFANDQSCRNAVISSRIKGSANLVPSSNTAAYCKARARLREDQLQRAAEYIGESIHLRSNKSWLWCGRLVKLVDGTTISMPDTERNQQAYPQNSAQKPINGARRWRSEPITGLRRSKVNMVQPTFVAKPATCGARHLTWHLTFVYCGARGSISDSHEPL